MDAQVGRLLYALEANGLTDNTVLILWSDHGWHLGEKGISGKNTLWERSTRVPLVFAGPRVAGGARCDKPVELLTAPTQGETIAATTAHVSGWIEAGVIQSRPRSTRSKQFHQFTTQTRRRHAKETAGMATDAGEVMQC
jgi:arylsulfatase A-like enzyme